MDPHLDLITLDEMLRGDGNQAAREHLGACDRCRAEADSLKAIAEALRDDDGRHHRSIPAVVDRDILDHARRRAALIRSRGVARRIGWLRPAVGLAIAAGALLSLRLSFDALPLPGSRAQQAGERAVTAQHGDVDGDGRVTILDAFALARQSTASSEPEERNPDIARIAERAVSLGRGA